MFVANEQDLDQLWGKGNIRAFICHKAKDKQLAKDIKTRFKKYGVACFVAHEDIVPLKEWEPEIERALFSMHVLIVLLTPKFSESDWTDQEIGVAVGREIPIVPVRMGKDPYGLIGKYQALPGAIDNGEQVCEDIVEFLFRYQGEGIELKELAKEIFIAALGQSRSFSQANSLGKFLKGFDSLSSEQANRLVKAFNENRQVYQASGFYPIAAEELSRLTGKPYSLQGNVTPYGLKWLEKCEEEREITDPDDLPF